MSAQVDADFREFMHGRWPAMVRLAYALTGGQGHAEDVAQAAFARACASWPKVRRTENPEGYEPGGTVVSRSGRAACAVRWDSVSILK
jgi:DNA-directed RNA polymerase specialized sigma24 family protein